MDHNDMKNYLKEFTEARNPHHEALANAADGQADLNVNIELVRNIQNLYGDKMYTRSKSRYTWSLAIVSILSLVWVIGNLTLALWVGVSFANELIKSKKLEFQVTATVGPKI